MPIEVRLWCRGVEYLNREKDVASGLWEHFNQAVKSPHRELNAGDLVFYGRSKERITHIMLALGPSLCVGASGGDSTTTTREEARRRGAAVKVKPIDYRRDRVGIVQLAFPGE